MPELRNKFLHLPVRRHQCFSTFRVVPPSRAHPEDLRWAKSKFGIKRLPRNSQLLVGKLKRNVRVKGEKVLRGKRVKRYSWAIVTLRIPKNSKEAKRIRRRLGL